MRFSEFMPSLYCGQGDKSIRYRKQSLTGDYTFGQNLQNFYIDEPAAVGQAVKTRLLLWLGEWFLDTAEGTPYMQGILGKHSQSVADATVQNRIQGTQGFSGFTGFQSSLNPGTRAYSVNNTDINTIYGPTSVQLQNLVNY